MSDQEPVGSSEVISAGVEIPLPPLSLVVEAPPRPPRVWPVFVAAGAVLPLMICVWIIAFVFWFIIKSPGAMASPQDAQAGLTA